MSEKVESVDVGTGIDLSTDMKRCIKCEELKPRTPEYFHRAKTTKDGLRNNCKKCNREYSKKYYEENREHYREYYKKYYEENRDHYRERSKEYREENRECLREYSRKYYEENRERHRKYYEENREYYKKYREENRERLREYRKKYYEENGERLREHHKKYREENRERYTLYGQQRRARVRQLPHTLTVDEWLEIKDRFDNSCAYCGMTESYHKNRYNENLHQEHIIPVKEGGGYVFNNIIPCCRKCNTSKSASDLREWYRNQRFFKEEREALILYHLYKVEF